MAQKIESYREEEDGIKEAILSAQKIGKDAIQEAKDKAAVMLADAEENAKALLATPGTTPPRPPGSTPSRWSRSATSWRR